MPGYPGPSLEVEGRGSQKSTPTPEHQGFISHHGAGFDSPNAQGTLVLWEVAGGGGNHQDPLTL